MGIKIPSEIALNLNNDNPEISIQQKEIYSIEASNVTEDLSNNLILTTINDLYNWARLSSLWPLLYGTSCCFIEFASLLASRFDFDRFGLVPRSSPKQADLIITAGTVTMKMAPSLVRLYEQMPEPKYVIAMGACTITGGMFSTDSYTTVRGVDKLIPVDIYLPGCPPKPEAIIDAIIKLRKKVGQETIADRSLRNRKHNYHVKKHNFKYVNAIYTGQYLSNEKTSTKGTLTEGTEKALTSSVNYTEGTNKNYVNSKE